MSFLLMTQALHLIILLQRGAEGHAPNMGVGWWKTFLKWRQVGEETSSMYFPGATRGNAMRVHTKTDLRTDLVRACTLLK